MRRIAMALAALLTTMAVTLGLPAAPALAAPDKVTATEVSFTGSGGVVLHGTVLAPASGAARRPGLVMLEGAGNRGGRAYLRPEAEAYARHGVVTLVYDKRTVGYSLLHRDYSMLADDALAGLRLLRARADVDPTRLGLWALSEGAFVAPIAANRSTEVTFLITVGAVGTTPAAQTAWAYGQYLHHAGIHGSLPLIMRTTAVRTAIGAHLFPEADFDPVPFWRQVRQPVLAQWGQLDRDALPRQSGQLIGAALDQGGNRHHILRVVAGVNHDLHLTADAGFDRLPTLPADYADYETAWITDPSGVPVGPGVALAAEPAAPTLAPDGWYDTIWTQLAILLLLLCAFAGYPLAGAIRRVRHGVRRWSPRSARGLAVLAPATIVGTLVYLLFLLANAAKVTGPVVLGRPAPWLALQLLAVAAVVATAAVAATWRRHRQLGAADRIRLGLLTAGGTLFIVWAIQWGLLVP